MRPFLLTVFVFISLNCVGQTPIEADMNELKLNQSDLFNFFKETFTGTITDANSDAVFVFMTGSLVDGKVNLTDLSLSQGYQNEELLRTIRKKMTDDYPTFLERLGKKVNNKFQFQIRVSPKTNTLLYASVGETWIIEKSNK